MARIPLLELMAAVISISAPALGGLVGKQTPAKVKRATPPSMSVAVRAAQRGLRRVVWITRATPRSKAPPSM